MSTVMNAFSPDKRIFLIDGSPHRAGYTSRLIRAFRGSCPPGGVWDVWRCYDYPVVPCDDCGYCHLHDGCSKPDLESFYRLLEEADVLVIATPVHNLSYSAPLKTLLDRTQRYWAARFIRGKKPPIVRCKQAVLLTMAEADAQGGKMVEQQLKPTLTILNSQLIASVHALCGDEPTEWRGQVEKAAEKLALEAPECT